MTSTPHPSPGSHNEVLRLYGLFMVAWSVIDSAIQAAITKELKLTPIQGQIVTTTMQFRQRNAILVSLLGLHREEHRETIRLLQRLEKNARRNILVHGHIIVGVPGQLTFVKTSASEDAGFKAKKVSFTAEALMRHINTLTANTDRLQALLKITDSNMQQLANEALQAAEQINQSR